MSHVTLVNKTKKPPRMLVLNLTKQAAPKKVVNRTTEESRDGSRRIRVIEKVVPDAIRIPAKGRAHKVNEKFLSCPEVQAAIARREIAVIRPTPVAQKSSGQGEATAKPKQRRKKRG